ncbi:MAG: citrate synthase, partial [Peptococcaceae bacterium]|nr:citrate synthase [Peptococcaceae bacterium]
MTKTEQLINYIAKKAVTCENNCRIDYKLYDEFGVKKGLRDENGKGVLVGLTNISHIHSFVENEAGERVPCEGKLWYRGYDIIDLVRGFREEGRYGFEEATYLLLFGNLPNETELSNFKQVLGGMRRLPKSFTRDVIMKAPTKDIMNSLSRSVLTLASYDEDAADLSIENVLRQCMMLISVFPMMAVYGYHAYNHYLQDDSLYIHRPDPDLSAAENILRMLRPDKQYTDLEAHVLDIALVLHMEHGGGNNSSFTTHVITSAGSDTYSVVAA